MAQSSKPNRLRTSETTIAILLTFVAGYVDAVGFLRLSGVYTANMSGNSIAVGMHFARSDWPTVLERILPIGCYVASLFVTRLCVDLALIRGFRRIAAISFLAETVFLILFVNSTGLNSGIAFAAIAMGTQAATITRFNGVTLHTAFVTGSLIRLAETSSEWLIGQHDREQSGKNAIWFLSAWLAYVAGAAGGAAVFAQAGLRAAIFACLVLGGLAVRDVFRPSEFVVTGA